MNNSLVTAAVSAAFAIGGFFAGVGGTDVAMNVVSPPTRGLQLSALEYDTAKNVFRQKIEPVGTQSVKAEWAANIFRGSELLCAGGGTGNYRGITIEFTPDAWTGSRCPPLRPGDFASATWEYKNSEGVLVSVSGQIIVGSELAP